MVKIICTISPKTQNLKDVDISRINGAFGSKDEILCLMKKAREDIKSRILLDLPRERKKKRTNNLTDEDLLQLAISEKIEMVGISYVTDHRDVEEIKLRLKGTQIKAISKIETLQAVENIDNIIASSDGIMIDRGDLAMSIGIEMLARIQKRVVRKCNQSGKEVIVATELLKSMQCDSEPTKAEVLDIANSISDGADYLMLSEETAIGDYPQHAVDVLKRLIDRLSEEYKVLILSAGENASLGALSANQHACMIDIGGKTILESQLETLRANGIHDEDIIIGTGKGSDAIRSKIKGFDIQTVFNPWYNTTNMLTTIWLARDRLKNGFIIVYGDIVFEHEIFRKLMNNKNDIVLAVEKKQCDEEDEKICVKNQSMVLHRDYDKLPMPKHKCLPCNEVYGEFIGIAKLNRYGAVHLFEEMDEIMRQRKFQTYLVTAFEQMVKKGIMLNIEAINGLLWNDNDTIYDLKRTKNQIWPAIMERQIRAQRSEASGVYYH